MARPISNFRNQKLITDRIIIRPKTRCWIWTGDQHKDGYGKIELRENGSYKRYRAHRISYEVFNGPIPDGLHVLHIVCDNPICVNPEHLKIGTNQDNVDDRMKKGRSGNLGEHCNKSKLKNKDIFEIREKYASGNYNQYELAEIYLIDQSEISRIVNNIRWAHLGGVS